MIRMNHHHDIVHQDEVHCSVRGHFIPQQFHRSGPVVRGEEGGVGEDALLLTLDQPRHHLDVQRRVILPRESYTLFVEKVRVHFNITYHNQQAKWARVVAAFSQSAAMGCICK